MLIHKLVTKKCHALAYTLAKNRKSSKDSYKQSSAACGLGTTQEKMPPPSFGENAVDGILQHRNFLLTSNQ